MYEAFYGLREKPFNLTPDPRFLYLSEKHREAFAHLLFGIRNRQGFVMVTGEIGTGKTTICRTLMNQLDEDTEVAFIFNPCLSPEELLRKINEDFGIDSQAQTITGLIDELNTYLLDRAANGKNCVLLIDEAQNLTPPVLEQVRLLSNLETETQKLLQIVLVGQPELAMNLELAELRQLNQRITARYHLKPLNHEETLQYVAYRLRVAGGKRKVQFSRSAIREIYRFSRGTPRVINAVCDRALLVGYTREQRYITRQIVRRAGKELRGERIIRPRRHMLRRLAPSPSVLFAAALIILTSQLIVAPMLRALNSRNESSSRNSSEGGVLRDGAPTVAFPEAMAKIAEPAAAAAAVTAQDEPNTSMGRLNTLDPALTRTAAVVGVLRAWNMAVLPGYPSDDSLPGLVAFAQTNGLACEVLYPRMDQLLAINLPAIVRIAGDRESKWVGLLGADNGTLRVATGIGESRSIPRSVFAERYLNQAVIVWQNPSPEAPVLKELLSGPVVRDLQEQLHALGRLSTPLSGVYDGPTVSAVREIQAQTGLVVDGRVGSQTRMVLASWLPNVPTPSLRPTATPPSDNRGAPADLEAQLSVTQRTAAPRQEPVRSGALPHPSPPSPKAEETEIRANETQPGNDVSQPLAPEQAGAQGSAATGEGSPQPAPNASPEPQENAETNAGTPPPQETPSPTSDAGAGERVLIELLEDLPVGPSAPSPPTQDGNGVTAPSVSGLLLVPHEQTETSMHEENS